MDVIESREWLKKKSQLNLIMWDENAIGCFKKDLPSFADLRGSFIRVEPKINVESELCHPQINFPTNFIASISFTLKYSMLIMSPLSLSRTCSNVAIVLRNVAKRGSSWTTPF